MKKGKQNRSRADRRAGNQTATAAGLHNIADLFRTAGVWRYTGVILGATYFVVASFLSFSYHKILDFGVESDFLFEYVPIARKIPEGTLLIGDFRGPVYPIVLAAMKAIVGDYFKAGMLIALVAAAVTLALSFSLIRRLFSPEIALSATLLLMANAYFFMFSYRVGTDMLFSALVTGSLYFLLATPTLTWTYLSASAVLGALAYLTRYNGIFILAAPLLMLFATSCGVNWKRRVLAAIVFVAIFFVCISPWGFYCLKQKGSFFYSANRLNIAFDIYGKNQMSREEFFWKGNPFENMSIPALVLYDPRVFFTALIWNFWEHGLEICEYLLGWLLTVLALGGLVMLIARRIAARQRLYLLLNLAFFLVLLPIHFEIRYPLFMLAGLFALSSCGLFFWRMNPGTSLRTVSVLALMIVVIYTVFGAYAINRREISSGPTEILAIANQVKNIIPAEDRMTSVAARKPHIAYYTGLDYVALPLANSPEELVKQLQQAQVAYLYFGPVEYSTRPELRSLINPTKSLPGLKAIATSANPFSVLYKIE